MESKGNPKKSSFLLVSCPVLYSKMLVLMKAKRYLFLTEVRSLGIDSLQQISCLKTYSVRYRVKDVAGVSDK